MQVGHNDLVFQGYDSASSDSEQEQCSICFGRMCNSIDITRCGHRFHSVCVNTALKVSNYCPLCREFNPLNQAQQMTLGVEVKPLLDSARPLTEYDYAQYGNRTAPPLIFVNCLCIIICAAFGTLGSIFGAINVFTSYPCPLAGVDCEADNPNADTYLFCAALTSLSVSIFGTCVNLTMWSRITDNRVRAHRTWLDEGRRGPAPV